MAERLLFVTGKLAAPALRDTLGRTELPFDYEVAVTKIMIPGLCEGETERAGRALRNPRREGPRRPQAGIRVFAEINHVPRLSRERILELAGYYLDAGADVTDLGLSLERRWLDEGPAVIAELRERGFALSIDTIDREEILMADEAGVDYVLSLSGSNRDLAERLRATPVLIPDTPEDLGSLEATIAHLERLGSPTSSTRSSSR